MFEKTDKIIQKVINQKGLGKIAQSSRVCFEAEKIISENLPALKNRIEVISFNQGILRLSSKNAIINQEIQFKKGLLIKKINQQLKADLVKDLRFGIR